jgi:hypothetical protein
MVEWGYLVPLNGIDQGCAVAVVGGDGFQGDWGYK